MMPVIVGEQAPEVRTLAMVANLLVMLNILVREATRDLQHLHLHVSQQESLLVLLLLQCQLNQLVHRLLHLSTSSPTLLLSLVAPRRMAQFSKMSDQVGLHDFQRVLGQYMILPPMKMFRVLLSRTL